MMQEKYIEEAPLSKFLFGNTRMAWLWVIVRVYVGIQWLQAGIGKLTNSIWVGQDSGKAITGFVKGALTKTGGAHPDVQSWYAAFLENIVLPYPEFWSHFITYGEILVGIALIIGAFVGIAAFLGLFMNLNFLLAGAVSTNPILFTLSILLVLAWRTAGYIGIDYYFLRFFGTPWDPGEFFRKQKPDNRS